LPDKRGEGVPLQEFKQAINREYGKKMKHRSLLTKILFFLNLCAAAGLVVSYLAGVISPGKFWYAAFFGLAYPLLLILNIIFVIIWLITWNRLIFISLISIAAGYNNIQAIFPVRLSEPVEIPGRKIRIVSFNVHSLYGINPAVHAPEIKNRIVGFLAGQQADIICLQEFHANGEDFSRTMTGFAGSFHLKYFSFMNYREFENKRKIEAIATFSRFPVVNTGTFRLPGHSLFAIFSDLVIGRDTIRVYNLHLESIRFGKDDYTFYSGLTEPDIEENTTIQEGSKRIFWKLRKAFITRSKQVDILKGDIATCRYPVILAGDFNDTPASYTYHQLTRRLRDSFRESGRGLFMPTYAGNWPSFRIDYILYSGEFRSQAYKMFDVDLSDHYPIATNLLINK